MAPSGLGCWWLLLLLRQAGCVALPPPLLQLAPFGCFGGTIHISNSAEDNTDFFFWASELKKGDSRAQ